MNTGDFFKCALFLLVNQNQEAPLRSFKRSKLKRISLESDATASKHIKLEDYFSKKRQPNVISWMGDRLGETIKIQASGPVFISAASFWYSITGWEESLLISDNSAPN